MLFEFVGKILFFVFNSGEGHFFIDFFLGTFKSFGNDFKHSTLPKRIAFDKTI